MNKRLLMFIMFLLPMMACAHDFCVYNSEYVPIYYNYINDSTELEVTYSGANYRYQKNVVIPEEVTYMNRTLKVTQIGEKAFYNCKDLTYVSIPYTVTAIGNYAFYYCTNLAYVAIPNSVTSIGSNVFYHCTNLAYVKIPNSVTTIGSEAFSNCSNLVHVTIPNSVTTIEERTFSGCKNLTNVTIPNSVTSIGDGAFWRCSSMPYVTIPNSVTSIGDGVFSVCSQLKNVTIPNGVTSIGSRTFESCKDLKSVTIPNSVTSIGDWAFAYCGELTSVSIPNSVTTIGSYAFRGCQSLTSIIIPNGMTSIGNNAFWECMRLSSVSIPNSVTSIGSYAFWECALSIVISKIENPFDMYKDVFTLRTGATLYVPVGTIDKYKDKEGWSIFENIVEGSGPNGDGDDTPIGANKCEKPTISYKNGKLVFHSATEGVRYQYSITDSDIKTDNDREVLLNVTYNISVFATKAGYENSEIATATLCWIDVDPKTEGITNGVANVRANPVLIQSNGNVLTISGAPEGAEISVYNLSGQKVGSARAIPGSTDVFTSLQIGDVGIVKIGNRSVKIAIR